MKRCTRGRSRTLGQALVETALVAPFLLVLLTGSAQVGSVVYGLVQVDTAAREGARIGAESPYTALNSMSVGATYTCSGPSDTNPICSAAYNSAGLLNNSQLTVSIALQSTLSRLPDDVVLAGNRACNGSQATVTGTVYYPSSPTTVPDAWAVKVSSTVGSPPPSGPVGGTQGPGKYTLCANPGTQDLSAVATASPDGCTYSASVANLTFANNTSYTQDFTLIKSNCPATTTTTSTTTATATATSVSQTATAPPAVTCPTGQSFTYPTYVSVTVSYPVAIFVPFVNRYFGDAPPKDTTKRTVTITVTMQVEPCSISQGR